MKHHLDRAKYVYDKRGLVDFVSTAIGYVPIEINNAIFRLRHGQGTHVMDEDWDTLILLDACRYDMFKDRVPFDGTLESRISLGSTSKEFLSRNFSNKTFYDTVYVNTNPYLPKLDLDEGVFHAVVDLLDDWDSELETVHPNTVVEAALNAHCRFSNKRLIIHFMQPHFPFIGESGRKIMSKGWSTGRTASAEHKDTSGNQTIWQQLRERSNKTDVTQELAWEAYCENLDIVIKHVYRLINSINGRTVISTDHGNMVGERFRPIPSRRKYGHYYGVYLPELVRVPWYVIDSTERPEITAEPPVEMAGQADDMVEDRLDALGYR